MSSAVMYTFYGVQAARNVANLVDQTATEVQRYQTATESSAVSTLYGVQAARNVANLVDQTATEVQR
ncbi:hypothetical protein TNCT_21721, partial [Trichonephila clavata]